MQTHKVQMNESPIRIFFNMFIILLFFEKLKKKEVQFWLFKIP